MGVVSTETPTGTEVVNNQNHYQKIISTLHDNESSSFTSISAFIDVPSHSLCTRVNLCHSFWCVWDNIWQPDVDLLDSPLVNELENSSRTCRGQNLFQKVSVNWVKMKEREIFLCIDHEPSVTTWHYSRTFQAWIFHYYLSDDSFWYFSFSIFGKQNQTNTGIDNNPPLGRCLLPLLHRYFWLTGSIWYLMMIHWNDLLKFVVPVEYKGHY